MEINLKYDQALIKILAIMACKPLATLAANPADSSRIFNNIAL